MVSGLTRLKSMDIFRQLSEIPLSYEERDGALKRITELGQEALRSHACTLAFVDLEARTISVEACAGFDADFKSHITGRRVSLGSLARGDMVDYGLVASGEVIEQYGLQDEPKGIANPRTARRYGLRSVLSYPLRSGGKLVGYFSHFSNGSGPFADEERKLLELFASNAMVILKQFDYYHTLDRSVSVLHKLSQSLLSMKPDEVLRQISRDACELLKVPICIVWKLDEQRNKMRVVATHGEVSGEFKGLELSPTEPGIGQHIARKRPSYLIDVSQEHPWYMHSRQAAAQAWVSLMSAPMHVDDRIIGMLDVYTKEPRNFHPRERALFGTFANQAALSIYKAELEGLKQRLHGEIQEAIDKVYIDNSERVSVEDELGKTLELVAEKCAAYTRADACYLQLRNMEQGALEMTAAAPGGGGRGLVPPVPLGEGISGHVAETGAPYNCPDTSSELRHTPLGHEAQFASFLCVPVLTGDGVLGTISVGSRRAGAFGSEEQQLLESVVDKVSVVIMRAKMMLSLLGLAQASVASKSLDELLEKLVNLARDLMLESVCLVWLPDKKNRNGFTVRGRALPEEQRDEPLDDLFIDMEREEVQHFLRRRKSLKLDDASEKGEHPCFASLANFGWKSMLAVPLAFKDQVLGILEVYSYRRQRNFTGWHQSLFETFAAQASVAIASLTSRQWLDKQNRLMRDMAEVRDERELLELLRRRSLELVGADCGWVSQLNHETGELNIVAGEPPNSRPLKIGEGITGIALAEERPLLVGDVRRPELEGIYEKFWDDTRSELAVPILIRKAEVRVGEQVTHASKPIGVLNVESPTANAFSEEDANSLWLLAGHAAVALEQLEVNRKLSLLSAMETSLAGKQDWDVIIERVLDCIVEQLGYSFVNISLVVPEGRRIQTRYVRGIPDARREEFIKLADHSLDEDDIQACVVRSKNIEVPGPDDPRFDPVIFEKFGHADLLRVFIPMIVSPGEPAMGTVEVGHFKGCRKHIYEQDVQILKGFVDYTVRALQQRNRGLMKRIKHEVQQSITGIRNNASILQKRRNQLPPELVDLKLEDILTDCEVLKWQVSDLEHIIGVVPTSFSKRKKTFVFRDIVIKIIKQLRREIVSLGLDPLKVEYSSDRDEVYRIKAYVDRGRLSQVVFNLMSNSIKYAERDPSAFTIRISVRETRDTYIIVFKDWGIGISKGLEEKVFEDGFRAPEAYNRRVAGSGLGLTIARAAVREMGGDLVLANNYKPTEFHLILPKSLKESPNGKDTVRR